MGRRSAIRNEISDSWRMSFSVSFAIGWGPQPKGQAARPQHTKEPGWQIRPPSGSFRRFPALCGLGGLRLSPSGHAGREVRRPRERPVVAGPALAVRERLLDPVEAAEPAAEVVDHVHERGLARTR